MRKFYLIVLYMFIYMFGCNSSSKMTEHNETLDKFKNVIIHKDMELISEIASTKDTYHNGLTMQQWLRSHVEHEIRNIPTNNLDEAFRNGELTFSRNRDAFEINVKYGVDEYLYVFERKGNGYKLIDILYFD